jgi:hypothetical protein
MEVILSKFVGTIKKKPKTFNSINERFVISFEQSHFINFRPTKLNNLQLQKSYDWDCQ